jgi:hypothetical protein
LTRAIHITLLLFLPFVVTLGQEREKFFQVSGFITDEDKRELANVGVVSMKLRRGTLSEKNGIYSITSTPGDTILFKALGFKKKFLVVPEVFEGRLLNKDIVLSADTIPIENVVVLPWKSYNEFLKDMTAPIPVSTEIENMNQNIASIEAAISNTTGVMITPEAGYRYAMEQNFSNLTTRGQSPVNNLLNPFAWAKFINGVKNGLFKNKRFDNPEKNKARAKQKKRKKQ